MERQSLGSDPTVDLVRILRERREALGWPQSAVDERLGVADCLTAKWERHLRRPSPHMIWLWAKVLGCELVVQHGPAPEPPKRVRHKLDKRVRRGEGAGPITRACNGAVRPDAPANPFET